MGDSPTEIGLLEHTAWGQKKAVWQETLRHALEREVDSAHGLRDRSDRPDHLIRVLVVL